VPRLWAWERKQFLARVFVDRQLSATEAATFLVDLLGSRFSVALEHVEPDGTAWLMVRRNALVRASVRIRSVDGRSELSVRGSGFGLLHRAINQAGIARRVSRALRLATQRDVTLADLSEVTEAADSRAPIGSRSMERDEPLAVALRAVTKRFGGVEAVAGVSLTVRPGEVVAYLGPNGAGKTTTIDMILGLVRPNSGSVRVFGFEPQEAVRRGLVSAVMQAGGLLKDLTVAETLEYVSLLFPSSRPIFEVMERAGIARIAARRVGRCSGGEQQRLRFAMALLSDPELLILDEPTQGMDVEGRREFWSTIREEALAGRTIMFATHYLEEADAYADRIVLLRRGKIVADGTVAAVRAMVAGKTIRATLPGADAEALGRLLGVEVEVRGQTVLVHTFDADRVARQLLNETAAYDLEITARGLEDAFVALTAEANATTPAAMTSEGG
jgi:ABC-2 type transport system ATP-binding protein